VSDTRRAVIVDLASRKLDPVELIEGLRQRDPRAANALHHRYGPRINRWVWHMLGGDPEHDDVVHQVFVSILASIGKVRDPSSLDAWVDSVCVRTVRKEIRHRRYRRWVTPSSEAVDRAVDPHHPAQQVHIRRFYHLLDRMRPDDRIVLVLRYLEGCTLAEVADAGGYSLATAKRRLKRARAELKKRALEDPVLVSLLET